MHNCSHLSRRLQIRTKFNQLSVQLLTATFPDFLRKFHSPPFPLVTVTIYIFSLWCGFTLSLPVVCKTQGPEGCRHVSSVRRLWRPALAKEDKLVDVRSIRAGLRSTQENKETALMCRYIYCYKQWTLK